MKVYTEDLYNNVLKSNLNRYSKLKILSGYASSSLLEHIINEYPNLWIELNIGMAREGITKNEHAKFKKLSSNYVKVYYNTSNKYNHMKIYEFTNTEEKVYYTGSANFSDNGFIENEEILVQVDYNLNYI